MCKIYNAKELFLTRWRLSEPYTQLFFKMTHGEYDSSRLLAAHRFVAAIAADDLHRQQQPERTNKLSLKNILFGDGE